ncbi:MAG: radical SAM protein [Desulfobacterales bacterium]
MTGDWAALRRVEQIEANLAEYGDVGRILHWVTAEHARQAEAERNGLLASMENRLVESHKRTKPHLGPLSPGCRICGQGGWSCLFINGKCNCRCFYCPTTQEEFGIPTTNRVPFPRAGDYADYVRHFGFEGVSISGGEPLLTFDRTLNYIHKVRRRIGAGVHVWLYTNGVLLSETHLGKLSDAGLDEIRFDISAVGYDLSKVRMAVGRIPCVTVEIPAIPEDRGRLSALLPEMRDARVDHLNLHQLRLTPHNLPRLAGRPYTFLHGEKVTVLESELTALSLMQEADSRGIDLPMNYCSFVYKHRYQQSAARKRSAQLMCKPHESVTDNGYIRCLSAAGPPERIEAQIDLLEHRGADPLLWSATGRKDRIHFNERLWPLLAFRADELRVRYAEAMLSPRISYRSAFKEVRLNPGASLYVERQSRSQDFELLDDQKNAFEKTFISRDSETTDPEILAGGRFADYERIEEGLQRYF